MAFNTERFRKVHEIIEQEGKLGMAEWESSPMCGTTRCISGWAIYNEIGEPLFDRNGVSPAVHELADRLGVERENFELIGLKLLGMETRDVSVFYTDEDTAREFVALAAQGRDDEARRCCRELEDRG
jgi:hypothetical protein